jgi:hypothetical protein
MTVDLIHEFGVACSEMKPQFDSLLFPDLKKIAEGWSSSSGNG